MPRYDATTKHMVESAPLDWVALAGFPDVSTVKVVDADLSTVTAQADKVILIEEALPWMIHIEFQSGRDESIGLRQCRYNVLLEYRHRHPVLSVLVLLTQDADSPKVSGVLMRNLPDGTCYDEFRYHVIRVWELPVETILSGGLGTLPLAPLSGVSESQLPSIIERIRTRVEREISSTAERKEFWETTSILLGMRLPNLSVNSLIQGLVNMRESSVIQAFLDEGAEQGRIEGARRFLLKLAEHEFGAAPQAILDRINATSSPEVLEGIGIRIHEISSWDEFGLLLSQLETPK